MPVGKRTPGKGTPVWPSTSELAPSATPTCGVKPDTPHSSLPLIRRAMSLVTPSVVRRALLASLGAAGALHAQSTPRAMTLRDWYRVTTVSQPAVSPSGKHVAFTVTTVRETENKRHQEV